MSEALIRRAPAKINLFLEVLCKREDGFHDVVSVMHTLDFADELRFEAREDGELTLTTEPVGLCPVEDNLVFRAAQALQAETGTQYGAAIHLKKNIPHGAGLGGGSSDAATTLTTLNDLWGCGFSVERLSEIGARLGSDIPFFLYAPVAAVRGTGTELDSALDLRRVADLPQYLTLVYPAIHCATPEVYQSGAIDLTAERVAFGSALPFNRLQAACTKVYAEVGLAIAAADQALDGFSESPAYPAFLSGSGSSFAYFWGNAGHAAAAAETLRRECPADWQVFATRLARA